MKPLYRETDLFSAVRCLPKMGPLQNFHGTFKSLGKVFDNQKLIKIDSKDFYDIKKDFDCKLTLFFGIFYSSHNHDKEYHGFHKKITDAALVSI